MYWHMRYRPKYPKLLALVVAVLPLGGAAAAQERRRQLVTFCWEDLGKLDSVGVSQQAMAPGNEGFAVCSDTFGIFSVRRGKRTLFTFDVEDLSTNADVI